MELFVLALLASFMVVVFVWSSVLAQGRRGPVAMAYNLFSLAAACWLCVEILLHIPSLAGWEMALLRISVPFWMSIGFLFLNFAYSLVGRARDWLWWIVLVTTVSSAVITSTTDLVIIGFERFAWGVAPHSNHKLHALLTLPDVAGGVFGLLLVYLRFRSVSRDLEKRALGSVLVGGSLTLGAIGFSNIVVPDLIEITDIAPYGSSALGLFVLMIYRAVTKYRFMTITVNRVAEDLFRDMQDGVILTDNERRVGRMNRSAQEMLGVRDGDWEGVVLRDVLETADIPEGAGETELAIGEGDDKKVYLVSQSEGMVGGVERIWLIILKDITHELEAQEALRRSRDQLELSVHKRTEEFRRAQRMEVMGVLGAGIAHDFNNLLAAVMGFAAAARDDLPENHPIREDLVEVLQATKRGRDIVKQMLTFSPTGESRAAVVSLARLTGEALKLMEISKPPLVRIETDLEGRGFDINADGTAIHQVIVNLVKNAFQAMTEEGGTLRVSLTSEKMRGSQVDGGPLIELGDYVVLTIADTGPGMEQSVLEKIFDPFFTTKREEEGTGLGLAMAEGVVSRHAGAITATSAPAGGATFRVYLPRVQETNLEEDVGADWAEGGEERVMLIDDKAQVLRVGKRLLEQLGYRVTTFDDPRVAVAQLQGSADKYDVVITDLSMPHLSGIDVGREVARLGKSIPVILTSGNLTDRDRADAREVGIVAALFKPLTKALIATTVRRVIEGKGDGR